MKSGLTLIILFVGAFLLTLIVIAGIGQKDVGSTTDISQVQDTMKAADDTATEQIKPFILGLSGIQMVLLVLLALGGIGVFLKLIFGRRASL